MTSISTKIKNKIYLREKQVLPFPAKRKYKNSITIIFTWLRYVLFWDVTQRRVVIPYRSFGTNYLSHLQGSRIPRRMHSCSICHSKLFNGPERGRCHLHRGGSLKPHICIGLLRATCFVFCTKP